MAKVKCSACGQLKFVNPQALIARVAKYGSVEEIEKKWTCSSCNPGKKKTQKTKAEKEVKNTEEYEEPTITIEEEEEIEDMLAKQ